ncbi:MAG: hypothetical protein Hens3KO_05770 [Henriciella sp.]
MRGWGLGLCIIVLVGGPIFAQEDTGPSEDAKPITRPVPSYPLMAAMFGMIGYCEVRFAVDVDGYAFNLITSCTDYIFCYQSKKAVNRVRFEPAYENGYPRVRYDVIYPLEYMLEGVDRNSIEHKPVKPCREVPIS